MDSKICTHCNIEKSTEDFYNKFTECRICNSNRKSKRYYEIKDKISNRKKHIMKKIEKSYYKNKIIDIQFVKN